jgi:hypothetical protein
MKGVQIDQNEKSEDLLERESIRQSTAVIHSTGKYR